MLEQRIQQQFFESADQQYQAAEVLSRPLAEAAQALLTAITYGGKVILVGSGTSHALATHMACLLAGRFERDRPPLAAMVLSSQGDAMQSGWSQQLRALAQPGDVLLALDGQGDIGALTAAVQAASSREATVVLITDSNGSAWREALSETDVLVAVPAGRRPRTTELQLLALHCLCDALDSQLMGDHDA